MAGSRAAKLNSARIRPDSVADGARMRRRPAILLRDETAMAGMLQFSLKKEKKTKG